MAGLPDHPDKFDPDWLAGKLGRAAGSLRGWTLQPVGTGQMGDSYRLVLDWAGGSGRPATIIAKCPAADRQSRETGRRLHSYEVEVRWYERFAARAKIRVPHCYFTRLDAAGDFVLLMEDVAPARAGDQLAGGTAAQVRLAISEIAHLHNFRWNDPALVGIDWLNYTRGNRGFLREFIAQCYPEWRRRYAGRLDREVLEMGAALVARLERYFGDRGAPLAITHNDLRLDNILFTDAAGRAVIVDWQTIGAGAPMSDVAYCIGTSFADPALRAGAEAGLVEHYVSLLTGSYDGERAWRDYRFGAFGGFVMAVVAAQLVERTGRGDEMFAVMAERSGWQALHLDSLALL